MPLHREQVLYVHPGEAGDSSASSLSEQLGQCLRSIEKKLALYRLELQDVLRQTVFISAQSNDDFYIRRNELTAGLKQFYQSCYPPTGFVGQPPAGGALLAVELTVLINRDERIAVARKDLEGVRCLIVENAGCKTLYAFGITGADTTAGPLKQARDAFGLMKRILEKEGMDFSQVVRQWNYIENITGTTRFEDGERQNYQVFNDIRSLFYDEAEFENGFPAATGIGMDCGGIVLEFIAVKAPADMTITPIKNPNQVDAHLYTQEVLEGRAVEGLGQKTTPKFERAKVIGNGESSLVYISGTAAIRCQKVVYPSDAAEQTRVTIENIDELVSPGNLEDHGLFIFPAPRTFSYIRVYVKNESHFPGIKPICDNFFKDVPALYLIADICRGNLLVEIEGSLRLPAAER